MAFHLTNPLDTQIAALQSTLADGDSDTRRVLAQKQVLQAIKAAAEDANRTGDQPIDLAATQIATADGRRISAREALDEAGLADLVNPTHDGHVTANGLQSAYDSVDTATSRSDGQRQLQFLQLQELVHQRGLFLELVTNELSASEQIARRIADNIR